jgi:hypothetical protein
MSNIFMVAAIVTARRTHRRWSGLEKLILFIGGDSLSAIRCSRVDRVVEDHFRQAVTRSALRCRGRCSMSFYLCLPAQTPGSFPRINDCLTLKRRTLLRDSGMAVKRETKYLFYQKMRAPMLSPLTRGRDRAFSEVVATNQKLCDYNTPTTKCFRIVRRTAGHRQVEPVRFPLNSP